MTRKEHFIYTTFNLCVTHAFLLPVLEICMRYEYFTVMLEEVKKEYFALNSICLEFVFWPLS